MNVHGPHRAGKWRNIHADLPFARRALRVPAGRRAAPSCGYPWALDARFAGLRACSVTRHAPSRFSSRSATPMAADRSTLGRNDDAARPAEQRLISHTRFTVSDVCFFVRAVFVSLAMASGLCRLSRPERGKHHCRVPFSRVPHVVRPPSARTVYRAGASQRCRTSQLVGRGTCRVFARAPGGAVLFVRTSGGALRQVAGLRAACSRSRYSFCSIHLLCALSRPRAGFWF